MVDIIINGRAYDITLFRSIHPGGSVINEFIDKDATDMFLSIHGPNSQALKYLRILNSRVIDNNTANNDELSNNFKSLHMFATSRINGFKNAMTFAKEITILIGLGFTYSMLLYYSWYYASSFVAALFILHTGWLSHKIAHKHFFANKTANKYMGYIVGGTFGGYSSSWWNVKHNIKHHSHTNVIGKDEDIDTLPLLKWDKIKGPSFLGGYHCITVWIYLFMGRWLWLWYSISWPSNICEKIFIMMHYILLFTQLLYKLNVLQSLVWFVMTTSISGFLVGFIFLQNHNAEAVLEDQYPNPIKHTVMTTRNIHSNWFNDFISGHLNYQIEHHIFPWLPSYAYKDVQTQLRMICQKHNLPYKIYGWSESVFAIYKHLQKIT